jgi:hypothetical protein
LSCINLSEFVALVRSANADAVEEDLRHAFRVFAALVRSADTNADAVAEDLRHASASPPAMCNTLIFHH